MRPLLAILLLLSMTHFSTAETTPPPVPEGGLTFIMQQSCMDNETGQKGYCYLGKDKDGKIFLTFWQDGILMFIREVVGDSYITIWVNSVYDSI